MPIFDAASYTWASCVPELFVSDFQRSLNFYLLLGFIDQYQRKNFAYLDYAGAQLMIAQRDGTWETGEMTQPFGRGVNIQITTSELDGIIARLGSANVPLYEGKHEKQRDLGGQIGRFQEFLVLDPDGYLLRFSQKLD
jgi:catechol 2,3-dioxygenase-like lactoylglutathione lyase family enzyme